MTLEYDPAIDHDCTPALEPGCEAGTVLYTEGDDLYAAMIDSIARARHEINLESYLFRSLFLNYELNLFTRDEQLCRQLQVQFERDLAESAEIGLQVWGQRKWTEYFYESIGWLSRRWL